MRLWRRLAEGSIGRALDLAARAAGWGSIEELTGLLGVLAPGDGGASQGGAAGKGGRLDAARIHRFCTDRLGAGAADTQCL